jgi:putative Holliday junction resolvase
MNILGIDFGTKKLGLALLETDSEIASPLPILKNDQYLFEKLAAIIKSYRVTQIVLGLPSYENTQKKVLHFSELLKQYADVVIHFENEDNTSIGIKSDLTTKKQKEQLDSFSAVAILQQALPKLRARL